MFLIRNYIFHFSNKKGKVYKMGQTFTVNMGKVCELTQEKFWTIAELTRKAHLSQATYFSLKSGRRKASVLTVKKIAAALDVSPADIIEK